MKTFGRNPAGARLRRVEQSPHYRNGAFQNLTPTVVMREGASVVTMMREYLRKPTSVKPPGRLVSVQTDLTTLPNDPPTVVWFGHSSYLIRSGGLTILVDPVLSGYASPVSLFGKSFAGTDAYTVQDLPPIDLLIITHDHYDHLDYRTLVQLREKIARVVAPLGVGAHLEAWGVRPSQITELDWWETMTVAPDSQLVATPARHFSGRRLDRNRTLWASYVLYLPGYRLFLGGDSGYDAQFQRIGEAYGPFDLAILECGQYGQDWPQIHMTPEQTVQAAVDLRAKVLLPVHWGKFVLANHAWDEPIRRVWGAAAIASLPVVSPRIGEPFQLGAEPASALWWA